MRLQRALNNTRAFAEEREVNSLNINRENNKR